jgi:NTE family protein
MSWPFASQDVNARVPLSLALQGGGAHGAFTWGVLDALLERGLHRIVAVSGASAGAVNALLLAHGLLEGGADGARDSLSTFWLAQGQALPWDAWGLVGRDGESLSALGKWMLRWAQGLSPSQANPMGIDPLRDALIKGVDFERVRRQRVFQLHVAATHANTGRLRVFGNSELTIEVALASACLPSLQRTVVIDGQPYWDGGFSANPPLFPLLSGARGSDVLLVMLSPWHHGATPDSADAIRERTVTMAFNAAFLHEMRLIVEATAIAERAWWRGPLERRLRRTRWHVIDAHDHVITLPNDSKLMAYRPLLQRLHAAGRSRAQAWLTHEGPRLGRRSTVDLSALFGSDDALATSAD